MAVRCPVAGSGAAVSVARGGPLSMLASSPPSCGPHGPAMGSADEPEHREAGEVDRSGEEREVGGHLRSSPDPGPSPTVASTHEMGDAALDLRSGGTVVGQPGGIAPRRTGAHEDRPREDRP